MRILVLILFAGLTSCGPSAKDNDILVAFHDTLTDEYCYKNKKGEVIIQPGKYTLCWTDTFKTYAIVVKPNSGFVAIDKQENVLYQIFTYDNGPDNASDGLFRIIENNKIGFAESITGKVVINPQFDCAWPFEKGLARVSIDCKTQPEGEHSIWVSDQWFYIDKKGKKTDYPRRDR
jgi:hypothetical protein